MKNLIRSFLRYSWKFFTYNAFTPWIPVITWMTVIFIGSSLVLKEGLSPFTYADKCVHFVEFGILGFLLYCALYISKPNLPSVLRILSAAILTGLYGLSDEIHQLYVPTREFSLYDLTADITGALFFSCLAYLCQKHMIISSHSK